MTSNKRTEGTFRRCMGNLHWFHLFCCLVVIVYVGVRFANYNESVVTSAPSQGKGSNSFQNKNGKSKRTESENFISKHYVMDHSRQLLLELYTILIGRQKNVLLLGLPDKKEIGDYAITMGEMNLLQDLEATVLPRERIKSFSQTLYQAAKDAKLKSTDDSLVVLIQGGVLGNLDEDYQNKINIIEAFPNSRVVFFPQSLHPDKNSDALSQLYTAMHKHGDVHFVARDQTSFQQATKYFPKMQVYSAPDVASMVGHVTRIIAPFYKVVWIKRNESEAASYQVPCKLNGDKLDVMVADWSTMKGAEARGFDDFHRYALRMYHGISILQRGQVVVTDRLHGVILSILAEIPVVYLDDKLHVSNYVSTWHADLPNVKKARSPEHAAEQNAQEQNEDLNIVRLNQPVRKC